MRPDGRRAARRAQPAPNWRACRSANSPSGAGARPISSRTAPICRARCSRVPRSEPDIESSPVRRCAISRCTRDGVTVSIDRDGKIVEGDGLACWSAPTASGRACAAWPARPGKSRFPASSPGARTVRADSAAGAIARGIVRASTVQCVPASRLPLDRLSAARRRAVQPRRLHAEGERSARDWTEQGDPRCCATAMTRTAPAAGRAR